MKRHLFVLCAALVLTQACQHHANRPVTNALIRAQTDELFEKLVSIRRDLHEHPELAGKEMRTASMIAKHLQAMGLEVQTGQYGQSVIAKLRGAYPGKTIAWRAELDALPGDFADPASFKSRTPGVHHACGHDIHIAIALGIAEILSQHKHALHGTAVFIFQPEEETFQGAKALVDMGAMSSFAVDEVYGLHVTALPVGQILVRAKEMFAYQRRISIRLKNELSNIEVDGVIKRVQTTLSRTRSGAKPWEIQHSADPEIGLANPNSAFQDYLIMDPTFDIQKDKGELVLTSYLYETNAANLGGILQRVEQAIAASGHKHQLLSVAYVQENPTINNDPALTSYAVRILQQTERAEIKLAYGQVPFFNDDFAYFQQKIPGVYFFLGGSNIEKGFVAMNHAPGFQVDEESIRVGVSSFTSLMVERLAAKQ